jgi:hypothetical protein
MILRRITKHVTEQNWVAIGIDFFIVVIGVFIGIQVSNWNASLSQKERAHSYLERLEYDLASDLATLKNRREFYTGVMLYGNRALSYAEAEEQNREANWPIVLAFFQASQIFQYYPNDATYAELKSVGDLNLIENPDIRMKLTNYYLTGSEQFDFAFRSDPKYRATIRGLTPSMVTKYIWNNCHDTVKVNEQHFLECDSPIKAAEISRILDNYMSRPELIEQLRFWMSSLQTNHKILDVTRAGAQLLKNDIVTELTKN